MGEGNAYGWLQIFVTHPSFPVVITGPLLFLGIELNVGDKYEQEMVSTIEELIVKWERQTMSV